MWPELEIFRRGREEEVDSRGVGVLRGWIQDPHSVARKSMLVQRTLRAKLQGEDSNVHRCLSTRNNMQA